MSSSPRKKAPTSEMFPCPECSAARMVRSGWSAADGAQRMVRTVEDSRPDDVPSVRRLRHLKCQVCGARFFDDDAVRRIQSERAAFSESMKARD